MSERYLGSFEELVVLAVLGLPEAEAYAVPIQRHIAREARREVTLGSVYRTLSRREKKGFVRSRMGAVTPERGGKRKRLYAVTGFGQTAVVAAREARRRLWEHAEVNPALPHASL